MTSELALLGGSKAVKSNPEDVFTWPIVTKETEDAVLKVLRTGKMSDIDVYNQGKPTRIANSPTGVDVRQPAGSLPVSESIEERVFTVPWFKRYRPEIIRVCSSLQEGC